MIRKLVSEILFNHFIVNAQFFYIHELVCPTDLKLFCSCMIFSRLIFNLGLISMECDTNRMYMYYRLKEEIRILLSYNKR